jgi:hypothetical protein
MTTLREIVDGRRSGVYRTASGSHPAVDPPTTSVFIPPVRNKPALMEAFATTAGLPDWFGRNWDALAECLLDLPAPRHGGVVVGLTDPALLARHDPDAWRTLLALLEDVAADWQTRGGLFVVVVEGEAPGVRDLPIIAPG